MVYENLTFIIICVSMPILLLLIYNNKCLAREAKLRMCISAIMTLAASAAQWGAICMDGMNVNAMTVFKVAECLLLPESMLALATVFMKNKKERNAIFGISLVCICSVLISPIGDWFFYADENSRLCTGRFYFAYVLMCIAAFVILCLLFIRYTHSVRRSSMIIATLVCLFPVGISAAQIFSGNDTMIISVAGAVFQVFFYICYSETYMIEVENSLNTRKKTLETDALTGLLSRYAYSEIIAEYDLEEYLPANFAVARININGLKMANEAGGYPSGDELICGCADCIRKIFSSNAKCFRVDADDFVVMMNTGKQNMQKNIELLQKEILEWHGEKNESLSAAVGWMISNDSRDSNLQELLELAGESMMSVKNEYYIANKIDRRRATRREGIGRRSTDLQKKQDGNPQGSGQES